MSKADKWIRGVTVAVVAVLAAVAAVVSYSHIHAVVTSYGETGWVAYLIPLTIDGLIIVASMMLLDAARRGVASGALAKWALGIGIFLTLSANVLYGIEDGAIGAIGAAIPAGTLTIAFELLMGLVRRAAADTAGRTGAVELVAEEVAELVAEVVAEEVPAPIVEENPEEKPAPAETGTIRVRAEHVEAAIAFLATVENPGKVTGKHLADILPNMVARTRREVLRKARQEMAKNAPQVAADAVEETLPGMTLATA
ncbi:DUF2637 domain-containing protein [Nonomuraea roseola]|uniref:DUF2637 domain-containing protein n=1 Tax=Nonomuraea roseola TaxID=46179 RepID=A0ABV5Q0R9_9ACTN